MKLVNNSQEDSYNFFTSDWSKEERREAFSTEALERRIGEEYNLDPEDSAEYLNLVRMARAEEFKKKKDQEAYDAYQAEMVSLVADKKEQNFFTSFFEGIWDSQMLDNYIELPDGRVIEDNNYLPWISDDVDLVRGTYNREKFKELKGEELEKYKKLKIDVAVSMASSWFADKGAKLEEISDTVIDSFGGMIASLPMLFKGAGKSESWNKVGHWAATKFIDAGEFLYGQGISDPFRKDLKDWENSIEESEKANFAKMSEQEKKNYLENDPLMKEAIWLSQRQGIIDKQKEIRSQIINEASNIAGQGEVQGFFDSEAAGEVSKETINFNGKTYNLEIASDTGNAWDAKRLLIDSEGNPTLDKNGEPIYVDKFTIGEKYGHAVSRVPSMIGNRFESNMVWDGVGSAISFIAGGGGYGAAVKGTTKILGRAFEKSLVKGMTEKAANAFLKRANIMNGKYMKAIQTVANSYLMTNSESQTIGDQTFNNAYKNHLEKISGVNKEALVKEFSSKGLQGVELQNAVEKEVTHIISNYISENPEAQADAYGIAMSARQFAVTTNNMNTFLNLNYGAYFTKSQRLSKQLLKPDFSAKNILKTSGYLLKEAGQEYLEEGISNQYSQKAAEALAAGKYLSFHDYMENGMWTAESIESGLLGAMLGLGQSAIMEGIETGKNYRTYKKEQKE